VKTSTGFDEWLAGQSARVDEALVEIASELNEGKVAEVLAYVLKPGGKRLRPVLCLAAYAAVARREAPGALVRLASAVELININ
jgi:geranylgeranyl pyrophosphate synthase